VFGMTAKFFDLKMSTVADFESSIVSFFHGVSSEASSAFDNMLHE